MICKHSSVLYLASLVGLPAIANDGVDANQWSFAGATYQVSSQWLSSEPTGAQAMNSTVTVTRDKPLSKKQMKSLCRRGLGLNLRYHYEESLLTQGLIQERFDDWPFAHLTYELEDIQFTSLDQARAQCTATVIDSGYETNLQALALNYAVAYYQTNRSAQLTTLLPYLMKKPSVSGDAVGLVVLLLAQSNQEKAQNYYQKHFNLTRASRSEVKVWLAEWQFGQGEFYEAQSILTECNTSNCESIRLKVDDVLFEQQADSAGDLSSYF